jgi:DNA-binding NtrC family response regulator
MRKLLMIDDDPGVVEFLCESLAERGYQVDGCTSPRRALATLASDPPDLVIADIEMPEMRGTELLAAILAERPSQLVLLITAFGSVELAVQVVKAGACDFVAKPFEIETLVLAIERAFEERQMRKEIVRLRGALSLESPGELVARSASMRRVVDTARRAARSDATVLLTGETGTGKSALGRFIHDSSDRAAEPFVALNCGAIPSELLESELFGVKRGAFTDAREDREGLFVSARGGTLFLDEVGELTTAAQAKLLHALEHDRIRPVGETREVAVRARVMAATNRALETELREGRFRPDLYYRLNVIRIDVPPLRERRDDILPLVDRFLSRSGDKDGRALIGVSAPAMRRLMKHAWPGNVRELANVIERAVAMSEHDAILPEDLDLPPLTQGPGGFAPSPDRIVPLDSVERAYVRHVLESVGGNKAAAARTLGINRRTLYRKLEG